MSQSLRNERRRQVAYEIYGGLKSLKAIAKDHNISDSNARSACKQFGIDLKKAKEKLSQNVALAIEQGKTRTEAMSDFGVNSKFITSACSKHNVLLDPIGNNSERSFLILSDLLNTIDPLTIIAARHNTPASTVSKLYNLAIEKGFPIARRKQGQAVSESHPVLRIGICFDDAIDFEPLFFKNLTRRFCHISRIYILAGNDCGTKDKIIQELSLSGIVYHTLDLVDDRALFIRENKIDILFDDKDTVIAGLDSSILVLKPRTEGNFDFEVGKWIYTKETGEQI